MFLTNTLLKKVKSKFILVIAESVVTGHRRYLPRERVAEKLEFIHWDPFVRSQVVYKEVKKLKSIASK